MKKKPEADLEKKRILFFHVGLTISLFITIIFFEWRFYDDGDLMNLGNVNDIFEEIIEIPPTEQPPAPPPVIQQPEIIAVEDDIEIEQEIEINLDVEITEETTIEELIFSDEPEEEQADEIYDIVQQQAEPYGGISAFNKFLKDNLKYPSQARRMGTEGIVFVQFVVERDGSITNIKILKGIGSGCDEEAVRVLKKHPKWKPGQQRGIPVRARRTIPIRFILN